MKYNIERQVTGERYGNLYESMTDSEKVSFWEDIERLIDRLHPDELPRTRIYVVSDDHAHWAFSSPRKSGMIIKDRYSVLLEQDTIKEDGLVIRVILNKYSMKNRLSEYLSELKFSGVKLGKLLAFADTRGGITFHQVLKEAFDSKYADRTTRFTLADGIEAIYDGGEIVFTSEAWNVTLPRLLFPKDKLPWGYHFERDAYSHYTDVYFRFNLYGDAWKKRSL
jgi:hypothetical protein